jgi:hypothetical protein
MLAPLSVEGQLQTGASRHPRRCPKRQQGVAPAKLPLRAPTYEHIRNGTSSSLDPQPL